MHLHQFVWLNCFCEELFEFEALEMESEQSESFLNRQETNSLIIHYLKLPTFDHTLLFFF